MALVATLVSACLAASVAGATVVFGHPILGRIEEAFHRLGGVHHFGFATTPESIAANNGRFQHFRNSASIYWHPGVDRGVAHAVEGRIRDAWARGGWEHSVLGYPITDELPTPDGVGRFNHFQGGSVYWSPASDAHQIGGAIRDKWASQGWETGPLGYPRTDELITPDGRGRFNRFDHGFIYWSAATGAHIVTKDIFDVWAATGWEAGRLGYPISDKYEVNGSVRQDFQRGAIQIFAPTGMVLPRFDNAAYSSYRQIYPLLTTSQAPEVHPAGVHREVTQHMGKYFPVPGCPDVVTVGTTCALPTAGGGTGQVRVTRMSDTGFSVTTQAGHPEGQGRILNIRFDTVTAPDTAESEVVFADDGLRKAYIGSDKTWIRMIVEAFGETSTSRVAGPFISDHVGTHVFSTMANTLRSALPRATTVYGPVTAHR
ncbi:hypothetical protein F7230_01835 [Corynebacterium sp. 320]|uniref:LGFP repeat-containing protein n=1 Tax=Corynebacterium TaxID=1716 RepID=UPI00125CA9BA|nr:MULTISPECIES: hypothetical protein [Corynebacterium]KAB1504533.1 hypothetical protein F7230_01835 [Corynebacterium sp. 320]KAB1553406.1 hypothetical protein F7233_04760 [Corynebacterium sp. 321]KAB1553753.1 hypothetical protein F7232_01820 [Corynebacterium sp. 319]KAB3528669.1 hypothetical protein F8354_01835 [Corynebacterium sp. 250]KAB3540501.1 hypothetical protein F8390_04505 [Corynebacterium sp. 366]